MATAAPLNRTDALAVPWTDAVRFIRQLSHDLRNHLNAIELQSVYISEFEATAERKAEIDRLRKMLSGLTSALQKISVGLAELGTNLIAYRASDFVQDLRKTIAREFPDKSGEINWTMDTGPAMLQIDPELLQQAFIEVFSNAFQHDRGKGALRIACKIDRNRLVFTIHEPKIRFKSSTQNWGREPLRHITRGHYGLGLYRVRAIMEAHGGDMRAQYDPTGSELVTTLILPLQREES